MNRIARRCAECGEPLSVRRETTPYPESGLPNVVLENVPMWRCVNGHEEVEIPAVRELHELLAQQVLRKPARLTGAEMRFLRKRAGLNAKEFASRLGLHPVTLSNLETGRHRIQRATDLLVRLYCAHLIAAKGGLPLPPDMLPVLEELERGIDVGQHRLKHMDAVEGTETSPVHEWASVQS